MMLVPLMWGIWAALVMLLLALKIYAGRLSRDEDDQLVLDDSFQHVREEQAAIAARLQRLQPMVRTVLYLVGIATLFVAVYYIRDIIRQFQ
jgi:uncharacterized membrane protein